MIEMAIIHNATQYNNNREKERVKVEHLALLKLLKSVTVPSERKDNPQNMVKYFASEVTMSVTMATVSNRK